jgi:hypothetical protein
MDPVSALSVAAAAVSFADFSGKVVKSIVYAYRFIESDGSPEQFQQLRDDAERLRSLNLRLQKSLTVDVLKRQRTETEDDVLAVADECFDVASSLLQTLNKYDLANEASKMKAVRSAIKATLNKGKLESLNRRLVELQQRLMAVIVLGLREDISESAKALAGVRSENRSSLGDDCSVGEEILKQLKEVTRWQENLDLAFKQLQLDTTIARSLPAVEEEIAIERPIIDLSTTLRNTLLRSLEFAEMSTREEHVASAHDETFEWIFEKTETSWSNFARWLEDGTGLYWIAGKAASGKSTLMKYIVHHEKTISLLRAWTGDAEPIVASFYFWNTGSTMQTSQEGLLQTLLHQALSQYMSLHRDELSGRWEAFALSKDFGKPWTWQELERAFKFLLEDQDPSLKFCFFIDGLDEFKGDLDALITLTNKISQYSNAKVCVSSRPWMIFEDVFRTKPQLLVQDLTYADIRKYMNDKVTDHPGFMELRHLDEDSAVSLIDNVATYSSGVFLWVVLVVKSLLEGLQDGDHFSDLQKRLDDVPKELDDLFYRILHSFDTRYFRDASIIFQLVKAANKAGSGGLSLLELSLAEQADEESALQAAIEPMSQSEKLHRALKMRRRLQSRCKGLLEAGPVQLKITESAGETAIHLVSQWQRATDICKVLSHLSKVKTEDYDKIAQAGVFLLHRTVSDFLDRPEIWETFTAATGKSFKPHAALTQSMLIKTKRVYSAYSMHRPSELWRDIDQLYLYANFSETLEMFCQSKLLDEFYRTVVELFPLYDDGGKISAWNPLLMATRWRLPMYLEEKLSQEPQTEKKIWSLLKHAVIYKRHTGTLMTNAGAIAVLTDMTVVHILLQHIDLPETTKAKWLQTAERYRDSIYPPTRDEIEHEFEGLNPFKTQSAVPSIPGGSPKHQRSTRKYLKRLITWRKKPI